MSSRVPRGSKRSIEPTARSRTVPVAIIGMVQPDNIPWGEIAAGSILTLLPMMIVVFALQRHIVRGLTLGAVRE